MVVAGLLINVGLQQALDSLSRSYASSDGSGLIGFGTLIGLLGTILVIVGVHRLASHVDNLARGQRLLPIK